VISCRSTSGSPRAIGSIEAPSMSKSPGGVPIARNEPCGISGSGERCHAGSQSPLGSSVSGGISKRPSLGITMSPCWRLERRTLPPMPNRTRATKPDQIAPTLGAPVMVRFARSQADPTPRLGSVGASLVPNAGQEASQSSFGPRGSAGLRRSSGGFHCCRCRGDCSCCRRGLSPAVSIASRTRNCAAGGRTGASLPAQFPYRTPGGDRACTSGTSAGSRGNQLDRIGQRLFPCFGHAAPARRCKSAKGASASAGGAARRSASRSAGQRRQYWPDSPDQSPGVGRVRGDLARIAVLHSALIRPTRISRIGRHSRRSLHSRVPHHF